MSKFYVLQKEHIYKIRQLFEKQLNDTYVVINEFNGFSDIVQYSIKYDSVRLITVRTEKLDRKNEL